VCSDATGTWGALTLLREANRPYFTPAEVRFVASLAELLADGLRRAAVLADMPADSAYGDAGLLVLAPCDGVAMTNNAADAWLDELGAEGRDGAHLPVAVRAVAQRARATAEGNADSGLARARLRSKAGRWVVVRGSLLGDGPGSPVAILMEAARPIWRHSSLTPTASPNGNAFSRNSWRAASPPTRSPCGCTCRPTRCRTT